MFGLVRRPTPSPARRTPTFRPRLDALEGRTLLTFGFPSIPTYYINIPVNAQVLSYAESHVDQQVGNGQCADLARLAVASAGGVPYNQLGPTGLNANYVWGKLVATMTPGHSVNLAAIQPGDIIQFSNVSETDTAKFVASNGSTVTYKTSDLYQHHTAIVEAVDSRGDISVLEQNVQFYSGEPQYLQMQDQGGTVWGSSFTYYSYPKGYQYIEVTHTFNAGTMWVYQPYSTVRI